MKQQLIEKVREFREAFGFAQPEEAIHYKLTLEETDELVESILFCLSSDEGGDFTASVADALADRVFTSCGGVIDGCDMTHYLESTIRWAKMLDIDLPRAVDAVFTSNMSKLCSKSEIKPTADKYAAIGVDVRFEPVDELDESAGFRCICAHTVTGDDGKEYPAGKLLKSVGYREPCWNYLSE